MRYPSSDKLAIIRIVERSHLSDKQTLDRLGIARPTFNRWYDLYLRFGAEALEDQRLGWNRIPDKVRGDILDMALERTDLLLRELAVTFTDTKRFFVSEASV
jgi:putative transposase